MGSKDSERDEHLGFFNLALDIMAVAGLDGYLKRVNPSYCRVTGWSEAELLARPFFEIIHPDDRERATQELTRLAGGEETIGLDLRILCNGGGFCWIRWSVKPVAEEDRIYAVGSDITERKQAEALLAINAEILGHIAQGRALADTLDALVRALEGQAPGMLGSVLLTSDDGQHLRHGAAPSLPEAYNQAIDGIAVGPAVGSCGTAAHLRTAVVVEDIAIDPLWDNFRDLAAAYGLRACWSTPICSGAGDVLGTFAMYYRDPHAPDAIHLRLIDTATHLARVAIEHDQFGQRLRQGEERFRTMATEVPVGIFEADESGNNVFANQRLCSIVGRSPEQLYGRGWVDHVHPEDRSRVVAEWEYAVATGSEWFCEYRVVTPEGTVCSVAAAARRLGAPDGPARGYLGSYTDLTEVQAAEEREREFQREHLIAQTLQRSLLPDDLPRVPGTDLAVRYVAGAAGVDVGGDWYDAFALPNGQIGVAIGDVIGHGLGAAVVMGQHRTALRVLARRSTSPATVLAYLSELAEGAILEQMATVVYGVLDPQSGTLRFANAGHPPPLLRTSSGQVSYLLRRAVPAPRGSR